MSTQFDVDKYEILFEFYGADSVLALVKDLGERGAYYLKEMTSEGNEVISIYGISNETVAKRLKTWLERIRSN